LRGFVALLIICCDPFIVGLKDSGLMDGCDGCDGIDGADVVCMGMDGFNFVACDSNVVLVADNGGGGRSDAAFVGLDDFSFVGCDDIAFDGIGDAILDGFVAVDAVDTVDDVNGAEDDSFLTTLAFFGMEPSFSCVVVVVNFRLVLFTSFFVILDDLSLTVVAKLAAVEVVVASFLTPLAFF
jgi:hypothetical protein